jgi:hypothetical protein
VDPLPAKMPWDPMHVILSRMSRSWYGCGALPKSDVDELLHCALGKQSGDIFWQKVFSSLGIELK